MTDTLRITADVAGSQHEFSYPLGALEAARSSDMAGVLQQPVRQDR